MKIFYTLFLILGFCHVVIAVEGEKPVLSFKEWKSQQVQEAMLGVVRYRTELEKKKISHPYMEKSLLEDYESHLAQAQLNLETMRDLSVNDYFILYLSSEDGEKNQIFKRALKKLSEQEVVDLLLAYEQRLRYQREIDVTTAKALIVKPVQTPPKKEK